MVRAPCCEKMGLKKGPWTSEEDQILVSYIHKHGHGNWRALPKQAGLLRCGKSCRLRWTNYLRPDIKRGNFSKEEEETIISLHEMLGNRWSAIAAKLPGRTDNEIKNVWHTHLKKRLMPPKPNETGQESKLKKRSSGKANPKPKMAPQRLEEPRPVSPAQSDNSSVATSNESGSKEESMDSFEAFPEIDESFWSEALSMDNCSPVMDTACAAADPFGTFSSSTVTGEDMDFWLKLFMDAGDLPDLAVV